MTIEEFKLRVNRVLRVKLSKYRKINKNDFTIISNNCWAGMIYESYNLPKESPTVGLFFMASDYIKFVKNIKYYCSQELKFIDYKKSKYYQKDKDVSYPVALLGDIELFFVHYHSKEEAKEKWNRRIKRMNYENIIFKFNDQNGCTLKDVQDFLDLPYKNKLFFTVRKEFVIDNNCYKFSQLRHKNYIMASNEPFGRNHVININKYLNNIQKETYFKRNKKN